MQEFSWDMKQNHNTGMREAAKQHPHLWTEEFLKLDFWVSRKSKRSHWQSEYVFKLWASLDVVSIHYNIQIPSSRAKHVSSNELQQTFMWYVLWNNEFYSMLTWFQGTVF